MSVGIYDFNVTRLDGEPYSLSEHEGRVLLVVNTASQCGFTPQYAGLESLHREYGERGLTILGFPCNQFGKQEPGNADEIRSFCSTSYDVTFPMHAKLEVNGPRADPLYEHLKLAQPGLLGSKRIKWNFTKFLLDRSGSVVKRFAPLAKPKQLRSAIEALL
ncbi:MAG: glutathione peroxidase [Nannocystales bacterium]